MDGASSKNFKKTKTRCDVKEALSIFIANNQTILVSVSYFHFINAIKCIHISNLNYSNIKKKKTKKQTKEMNS